MSNLFENLKGESIKDSSSFCGFNSQFDNYGSNENDIGSKIYDNCNDNISWEISNSWNSKSIIQGSVSTSIRDIKLMKSIIYGKTYCKKCKIPCSIDILNNLDLSFECGCSLIKNFSILEFINEYVDRKEKNQYSKDSYQLYCHKHNKKKKFIKYCTDCGYDVCIECLKQNSDLYSNTSKINKKHENHTLTDLDDKIVERIKNIKKLINKYDDFFESYHNEDIKIKFYNLFIVINCIMENYNQNKCYNSYKSIENFEKFLEKRKDSLGFNFKLNTKKYPYIKLIKITSEKELYSNIKNFSDEPC